MQVEVDLKRMQTNFGGRGFSGFRVFASFQFCADKCLCSHSTYTVCVMAHILSLPLGLERLLQTLPLSPPLPLRVRCMTVTL